MTTDQIKRETEYHLAESIFLQLQNLGILKPEEVKEALDRSTKEFNPVWSGLPDIVG